MPETPAEGAEAPAFTLARDGGGSISLADFKGRPVVVYFYPRDDTSGCTKQAVGFTEAAADFAAAGATVIGVSADTVASHDMFKAKHGLEVILAADTDRSTIEAYGAWIEKSMYGRKYMGIDRSTFLVDGDGRLRRVWRKVKVPGHVKEVLEALRGL